MEGDWLVAMEQEAGRGRQGRPWIGETGNFFGSTIVELAPGDPAPPSLSLAACLARIEAVSVQKIRELHAKEPDPVVRQRAILI